MTQNEFIERAQKLWKGKFDYSLVEYKTLKDKIILICPHHGKFSQRAGGHLDGKDCGKCTKPISRRYNFYG